MIHASDEPRLWSAFQDHLETCAQCLDVKRPMCPDGKRLEHEWGLADAICNRRDQEGADLTDCADDERPWSPEL